LKPPVKRLPPAQAVTIERIGSDGDGIGRLPDGAPVYVPFTLPGETVTAEPTRSLGDGWIATGSVDQPSEARVTAPCRHFGTCGGCVLQHWRDADYRDWKAGLLTRALRLDQDAALLPGLPGERRRIDFAVRRTGRTIVLGLHGQRSADVADLTECLVLHPTLMALIQPLRELLTDLSAVKREASVVANLLDAGPDLLLRTDADLTLADRNALTDFATARGVPRVSHARGTDTPETIALLRPPETKLSGVTVRPPPGAFLQATEAGERAIIDAVLKALPTKLTSKSRVAELYAGCGTLTFALAGKLRVSAFEGDTAAFGALRQAINQGGLAGRIDASQRDLARQPILAKELAAFVALVLDPPHAGAAAQMAQIAASAIKTVIYVSCNPATLARDAKVLTGAGFRLESAVAIDQFLWSARVESVCVFRR
jgi:23S rRNA (uracil1939-C5)-methyltransferase